MELTKLSCGNCGGTLEVGVNAELVTCAFCGAQLQVQRSETACWSELQGALGQQANLIRGLHLKQDLTRCDAEWERTRQPYLRQGVEPSRANLSGFRTSMVTLGLIGLAMLTGWALAPRTMLNRSGPFVVRTVRTPTGNVEYVVPTTEWSRRNWEGPIAVMLAGGLTFLFVAGCLGLGYLAEKERTQQFLQARARYQDRREAILE